ncbi:MAG TPA: dihydrofolate reductase family protein [Bacteroidales bacterium]|nr:dihydrofolate reductase family protein [Bacteroidales bacterium]
MNHRKIVLSLCTSLDFFIEGENGAIDWCLTDQDYSMTSFLERIDTILLGRISYEQLIRDLPNAFADKRKIVFSTSLRNVEKGYELIKAAPDQAMHEILSAPGKDLWLFGGAKLAASFLTHNLIDEMMISIHPLLLGKGKPLFHDFDKRTNLKLTDSKVFSTGLVQLYYQVNK